MAKEIKNQPAKNYTLKEKYNYFKKCANTGYNGNGEKLDNVSKTRYANLAIKTQNRLDRFMKTKEFVQSNLKKK